MTSNLVDILISFQGIELQNVSFEPDSYVAPQMGAPKNVELHFTKFDAGELGYELFLFLYSFPEFAVSWNKLENLVP